MIRIKIDNCELVIMSNETDALKSTLIGNFLSAMNHGYQVKPLGYGAPTIMPGCCHGIGWSRSCNACARQETAL